MILALLLACAPKIDPGPAPVRVAAEPARVVTLPEPASPNVYLQAVIRAGSAFDPVGSEGLADLTARSLVQAGAGDLSGPELSEALYPTGNDVEVLVDREWVSLRLTCHRDHQDLCADRLLDVLTAPRFDDDDVARVRDEALYHVQDGLLADEEALGAEVLDAVLYEAHPYGHPVRGRAGVLPLLDADAARDFHRRHYVREAVVFGIAGSYDADLVDAVRVRLDALPGTRAPELVLLDPVPVEGRTLLAVDTDTPVTGFHLGHPLSVTRDHPDWPALAVAMHAFGAHRQSHGRLFRALRTERGLNYGTYAYAEPFVQRGYTSDPEQGVLRRQPAFRLWIRPTSLDNGPFALKLAVDELERLVADGLSEQELDDARRSLLLGLPLQARDPGRRLAYALDAAATDTPDPLVLLPERLPELTTDDVKAALQAHLRPTDLAIVAVSGEADDLRRTLVEDNTTPIVYTDVTPDAAQAARDAEVAATALGLSAARVTPAEGIFR